MCQIVGKWGIVQRKEAFRLPCYVCVSGEQVVERSISSHTLFWAARKRKGQGLHLRLFIGEHTPSMLQLSVLN